MKRYNLYAPCVAVTTIHCCTLSDLMDLLVAVSTLVPHVDDVVVMAMLGV